MAKGKEIEGGTNSSESNFIQVSSEYSKPNAEISEDNSKKESNINYNVINEKKNNNDDNDRCCICLENKNESVFIPCGHRCVCFDCGSAIMKSKKKKCPICQEVSSSLLKKVYDS